MKLLKPVVFFQKHSLNLTLWTLLALPAGYTQKEDHFSKNSERNNIDNPSDMDFLKLEPKPKLVVFDLGMFYSGGSGMISGGGGGCLGAQVSERHIVKFLFGNTVDDVIHGHIRYFFLDLRF